MPAVWAASKSSPPATASAPGPPTTRVTGLQAALQLAAPPSCQQPCPRPISRRARRVRILGVARTSTRAPKGRQLVRTAASHHHCSRISTIVQPVREAWGRVQPLVRCGKGGGRRRRYVGPFGRELEFIVTLSRPLLERLLGKVALPLRVVDLKQGPIVHDACRARAYRLGTCGVRGCAVGLHGVHQVG